MWASIGGPILVAVVISVANAVILARVINVKLDVHIQYIHKSLDHLTDRVDDVHSRIDTILDASSESAVLKVADQFRRPGTDGKAKG